MIGFVNGGLLADRGNMVRVGLVDSGFPSVPPYAQVHGALYASRNEHGRRVLSVFTALDGSYPLKGLELHLACYNPSTGYGGLAAALRLLPDCDILSLSLAWKDDSEEVRRLLERKFGAVCVPYSAKLPYPGKYGFTTTCSNVDNASAAWSIQPNPEWRGNSYAVPAIARLMAHGVDLKALDGMKDGIPVRELFSGIARTVSAPPKQPAKSGKMSCPHCHRYMRSKSNNGFILEESKNCPYCGLPLNGGIVK